jgi:hypothetical protein
MSALSLLLQTILSARGETDTITRRSTMTVGRKVANAEPGTRAGRRNDCPIVGTLDDTLIHTVPRRGHEARSRRGDERVWDERGTGPRRFGRPLLRAER